ncbi:MAG: carboxylating nicotinate-nucleotide diphosphorylase [Oscillatoriales cyanobacterium SM2_2_1]|nr:carboxylating nicotinate-nucleotide diphosphorylase [Oscillatoriales cyanobacterium SM2_2_1]
MLPPPIVLDPLLADWLREDIGRGDRTTLSLFPQASPPGRARWIAKADGVIAGLPIAIRVFQLLESSLIAEALVMEGQAVQKGEPILSLAGALTTLLMGERVALNLAMRLSGIATRSRDFVQALAGSPIRLLDTRKTTPGLRLLEKYATFTGGAINHRHGLDDAVMIKDNHIAAAGSITAAVTLARDSIPLTTAIEVEAETLAQVQECLPLHLDVIMLDNMPPPLMQEAITLIRQHCPRTKIEASGNITLDTIPAIAHLDLDYVSTSAMVTRAPWLDLSMELLA